jgi:hypothetical protein
MSILKRRRSRRCTLSALYTRDCIVGLWWAPYAPGGPCTTPKADRLFRDTGLRDSFAVTALKHEPPKPAKLLQ